LFGERTIVASVVTGCLLAQAATVQAQAAVSPATASTPSSQPTPAVGAVPVDATAQPVARALAGSIVELEITQTVSTKTNHRGDAFTLRLAQPIMAGAQVLVPAGTTGGGEVIDAASPRWGGAPGKLILGARYLDYQGQRIPLRSMKLGGAGQTAYLAPQIIPWATGGDFEIKAGTLAEAKLAADFPPTQPSATPASPAAPPSATPASPAAPPKRAPADQGAPK
jgi:hypothetical protein